MKRHIVLPISGGSHPTLLILPRVSPDVGCLRVHTSRRHVVPSRSAISPSLAVATDPRPLPRPCSPILPCPLRSARIPRKTPAASSSNPRRRVLPQSKGGPL